LKILLATDGSAQSRGASELLARTPFLALGDEVGVLALRPAERPADGERTGGNRSNIAGEEVRRLRNAGIRAIPILRAGRPENCILDTAAEVAPDLLVVGSGQPSRVRRFFRGGVAREAARRAPCSVLIAKATAAPLPVDKLRNEAPLRIVIGFDGSPAARSAVTQVASLPPNEDTRITVVTALLLIRSFRTDVIQTVRPEWRDKQKAARAALERAAERLSHVTPRVDTVRRTGSCSARHVRSGWSGRRAAPHRGARHWSGSSFWQAWPCSWQGAKLWCGVRRHSPEPSACRRWWSE
jgi:nucleotide-binding universal stress UspA family protein